MARAKLYADRVNIIKMVKVAGKWPFAPVVERNGRIIRDHVWVSGHEEHHPEGRYYLEWYEAGRRCRRPVVKFEDLLPATARNASNSMPPKRASCLSQYELMRPLRRVV